MIFEGLRNFGGGVWTPQPPSLYATVGNKWGIQIAWCRRVVFSFLMGCRCRSGRVGGGVGTFRCCTRKVGSEVKIFVHLIESDPGNTEVTLCGSHARFQFPTGSPRQACFSKFPVPFLDLCRGPRHAACQCISWATSLILLQLHNLARVSVDSFIQNILRLLH